MLIMYIIYNILQYKYIYHNADFSLLGGVAPPLFKNFLTFLFYLIPPV